MSVSECMSSVLLMTAGQIFMNSFNASFLLLFLPVSPGFFAFKSNFVIFSQHSNVAASAKEMIFISDTDAYHRCNKRK